MDAQHPLTIKVINHYYKVFPDELQEALQDAIDEGEPISAQEFLKEEYEMTGLDRQNNKKNVRQDCNALINRFDYEAFKSIDFGMTNLEHFITKVYGLTEEQDIGCMIWMIINTAVFRLDTTVDFKKLCAFHTLSKSSLIGGYMMEVFRRDKHKFPDKTDREIHKIINKQYCLDLGYKNPMIDFVPYDSKTHISTNPAEFNIECGGVVEFTQAIRDSVCKVYTYTEEQPKKALKSKSSDISVNMKLKNIHFDMVYEKCYPESDFGKNYKHKSDLRKKFFSGEERTIFTSGSKMGKERIDYQLVMFNRLFQLEMNNMYE